MVTNEIRWVHDLIQVNVYANESVILTANFPDAVSWIEPYNEWFRCNIEKL